MNKNIVFKVIMLLVMSQAGFFASSYGMDSQKSKSSNSKRAKKKATAGNHNAGNSKPKQNNNQFVKQEKKKPALKDNAATSTQSGKSGQSGTSSEGEVKTPNQNSAQSPVNASNGNIVINSETTSPAVVLANVGKSPKLEPLSTTPQVPASVGLLNVPQPQASSTDISNSTPRDTKRLSANSTAIKAMTQALASQPAQRSGRPGSPTKRPTSPTRQRRNKILSEKLEAQDIQTKLELHCTALSKSNLFGLLFGDELDHPIDRDIIDACKGVIEDKLKELQVNIKDAKEILKQFEDYVDRYYPTAAPAANSSDSKYLVVEPANESNSAIALSPASDKAGDKDDKVVDPLAKAQKRIAELEKGNEKLLKRVRAQQDKDRSAEEELPRVKTELDSIKEANTKLTTELATALAKLKKAEDGCCVIL